MPLKMKAWSVSVIPEEDGKENIFLLSNYYMNLDISPWGSVF